MPFKIDEESEAWQQYYWEKQESLDKFKSKNKLSLDYKIARPKAVAPMIVHRKQYIVKTT